MKPLTSRHLLNPLAIVVAALVLVSGSAYAGQVLARNSVGTEQVKNNSLTTRDVRDSSLRARDVRRGTLTSREVKNGSLRKGDLAPGVAPEVYTFIGNVPSDGTTHTVLTIPDFSHFNVTCLTGGAPSHSFFVAFGEVGAPTQSHGISGSDLVDNDPVGAATVTGPGGGAGISASPPGIIFQGDYWGQSSTLVAHGSWQVGYPGATCRVRLQVVVDHAPVGPAPFTRLAPTAGSRCVQDLGAGYCVLTPSATKTGKR